MKQGNGRLIYAKGDCYEGVFNADKCNGQGKYTPVKSDEYEVAKVDDKEHGKGMLRKASDLFEQKRRRM